MTAAERAPTAADIIRELIPAHGWVLQVKVIERAGERGVTPRAARAVLALLACGEIEAEERLGQLWLRWRSGR